MPAAGYITKYIYIYIYIYIRKVETMEQLISKYTKNDWESLTSSHVASYSSSTILKLPTLSLVEEFRFG